jgi:hypothetical protein
MTPGIKYILDKLKDSIFHTSGIKDVFYLARIDDEGRVLIQVEEGKNEFKALGTMDTYSKYVYIRHMEGGNIMIDEIFDGRKLSCNHKRFNVVYNLRLVSGVKNADCYVLEDSLRTAIASTSVENTHEMKNIKLIPRKSVIDSMTVVKEESPKPKQFDKNLIFVAIDFDLVFEMNYY